MKIPSKIKHWQTALRRNPKGRQVLKNLQNDENVPPSIQKDVFDHITTSFHNIDTNPLSCFDKALENNPNSACAGPDAQPAPMALLTRFTPLRYILDQPEVRKRGYTAPHLRKKPGLLRNVPSIQLGYKPRWIVWCAWERPVALDINKGANLADILNRMGKRRTEICPMVRITYACNEVPTSPKVPTVFDAGSYDPFRPPSLNAPCGMTHPYNGKGTGYEEYVHKGFVVVNPNLELYWP